jgi:hypothetical protein
MKTFFQFLRVGAVLSVLLSAITMQAQLTIGEWTPIFKGVELARGTNVPVAGGEIPRLQVGFIVRVDLTDPDIELLTSPRNTNYIANQREVAGYTVSDFLRVHDVQLAINANYFAPGTYYLPPATPMDLFGLAVSQGTVVSEQQSSTYAATITFNSTNYPTFIRSNWPPVSVDGVYNAVSGNFPILVGGVNIGTRFDIDPRTAFALSEDRRYLFLLTIDGRQPGYSDGAALFDCGVWLKAVGAYDAINVDGGGSSTLVIEDSTGVPLRINRSSAVADSGMERTVGGHFGIYAKPVPGFINDVVVVPEDTSASISWTTTAPATSEILYGADVGLGSTSGINATEQTTHTVELTGLNVETGYYYQIKAVAGGQEHLSPLFYFTTTNFVTTNLVFDLTNVWKYSSTPLDGVNWKGTNYDDTNWLSGPGLLWVGPNNPDVQPRNTQMQINGATGFPYITYYFRTHFNVEGFKAGSSLLFSAFIDDGAVFYLNGVEIQGIRMPSEPTSTTLATSAPCGNVGNAVCLDEFRLGAGDLPSLKEGDNVLAVEVHNYNARSGDITFGLTLKQIDQIETQQPVPAELVVSYQNNSIEISWEGSGGTLQSAPDPAGPWNDVQEYPGNRVTIQPSENFQFFRLKR